MALVPPIVLLEHGSRLTDESGAYLLADGLDVEALPLPAPELVTFDRSTGQASWQGVQNASQYHVYRGLGAAGVRNELIGSTSSTSIAVGVLGDDEHYTIDVRAEDDYTMLVSAPSQPIHAAGPLRKL